MLDDDDEEGWTADQPSSAPVQTESETQELDALALMLEEEGNGSNSTSQSQPADGTESFTASELGLCMSDDESDAKATSSKKTSKFSSAFAGSKFSRQGEKPQSSPNESIDPLEMELRQMEERMKKIKQELSQKKKLNHDPGAESSRSFTKLTHIPQEAKHSMRTLTAEEEAKVYEKYGKKSLLHKGDTDSEDEEDERNPFEQKYNSFGREIKKRIAHEANEKRQASSSPYSENKRAEVLNRIKTACKSSPSQKTGWKGTDGSLVSLKHTEVRRIEPEDKNVMVDFYSGIRIV